MKVKRAIEIIKKGGFLYPSARRALEARLELCNEAAKDKTMIEYVLEKDADRKNSLTKRK